MKVNITSVAALALVQVLRQREPGDGVGLDPA